MFDMTRRKPMEIPKGMKECPSCGEVIPSKSSHETVTRVVRLHNKYGNALPGEFVQIEPRHLTIAVEQATMTMDEFEMLQSAKKVSEPSKKGRLTEMVEQGFESAKKQVEARIEAGKRHQEYLRRKAIEAGQDLPKGKPSHDQEPSPQERKQVEE